MNVQSWMIKSWATHEWYLPPEAENLPGFSHLSTHVRDMGSETGLRTGDTVWVAADEAADVGLAWEWVELKPGLVILADPNSIITNLQLVDSQGRNVVGLEKTVAINRLVHAMPWQQPVCALLAQDTSAPVRPPHSQAQQQTAQHQLEPGPTALPRSARIERPAVVNLGEKAAHMHSLAVRRRSADREPGTLIAPVRELRRAA